MKQPYLPPQATCLYFMAAEQVAAIAPIDLINGNSGLGTSATVSETDIRIEINL